MMAEDMMEQLEPGDPNVSAALRAGFGDTPAADWGALEARITEGARFRLATRRPRGWRAASRWARIAVPAGLAASVLLGAGLAVRGTEDDIALEDIVATAAVEGLPSDLASLGGESLLYALVAEGE